ncbi:hypothetical protein [Mycobacterium nebraskense]|nr:hypothetical protein [Mycobacterium nebraskense]
MTRDGDRRRGAGICDGVEQYRSHMQVFRLRFAKFLGPVRHA